MKLYTEEQVKQMLIKMDEFTLLHINRLMDEMTPIELPSDDEIISENQRSESELINLQPISLTEEWLVKSGASKQNGYQYRFLYGFLIIRNGICFYKYYDLEIELNYVHQIQNLYFALTGKELTHGGNK
jgi:hypothetical protein